MAVLLPTTQKEKQQTWKDLCVYNKNVGGYVRPNLTHLLNGIVISLQSKYHAEFNGHMHLVLETTEGQFYVAGSDLQNREEELKNHLCIIFT